MKKVNKYKMDIKQIYREETDLEPFHKSYGDYGSYDDKYVKWLEAKINYTRCCTEFADGKCKPMVNADWTYLRCECGKRFEPKG